VYGSDRGNTVVPYGGAIDILRFSAGPREARHGGCPGDGAEYDQPRPDRRRPAWWGKEASVAVARNCPCW